MQDKIPEGLTQLEYARHLLEEVLGWPSKGNIELIGDCIRSIGISRKLTHKKAYLYLARAVKLAKEQGIAVDHFFFANGVYTEVKPERSSRIPAFKRTSREELAAHEAHKQTPEYQQAKQELETAFMKLAGKVKMP